MCQSTQQFKNKVIKKGNKYHFSYSLHIFEVTSIHIVDHLNDHLIF